MDKGSSELLISLKPQYADAILAGQKTVELRRGRVNVNPGARLWIYSTLPRGRIEGSFTVDKVIAGSAATIWRQFGSRAFVSKQAFDEYVLGAKDVSAILIQ